jgi:hypothetical protein
MCKYLCFALKYEIIEFVQFIGGGVLQRIELVEYIQFVELIYGQD